ncbi:hypothetical protein GCM10019071_34430 [Sphingobium fuliginis]|uniref:Uncharacterized protein n=1 Tax=Sphingobium fuliginis (strain ATCC 27551) TaxID=336203 RepID=A0ABQ1F676_SPHSA|nr:hypothetical protein GCM10019071_34430 [Sphingobium fuliginis]
MVEYAHTLAAATAGVMLDGCVSRPIAFFRSKSKVENSRINYYDTIRFTYYKVEEWQIATNPRQMRAGMTTKGKSAATDRLALMGMRQINRVS